MKDDKSKGGNNTASSLKTPVNVIPDFDFNYQTGVAMQYINYNN